MATIDAGVEEPGQRPFDVDLREDVPRRRGELVSAALTVLRAHAVAGFPGWRREGRFGDWTKMVRGALIWLGEPDPWATQVGIRGGDSARGEADRLMEALAGCFGTETFAARDVCLEGGWHGEERTEAQEALAAALDEVSPSVMKPRGGPDTNKVAHMLKGRVNRIVRGRTIVLAGQHKLKGNLYRIGDAGDGR